MIYFLNKKVKEKIPIKQALMRIFGVGSFLSESFCKKIGINPILKLDEATPKQIALIIDTVFKDKDTFKEEELSRYLYGNSVRLAQIRCYRGLRYKKGLPIRGQRTRTNAKTAKRKNKVQNRLR
jgi:small subunit ribosomal protein S13